MAAAALLAACTKEVQEPLVEKITGRTVISAATPDPATGDSRTEMGDKSGNSYPTYWSVGDCISINGCPSLPLTSEDIKSDARMARFDVEGIIDSPFEAVYPLCAVASYDKGAYTVSLPASQNYTEGSFDPEAAVMLATGTTSLSFQNVLSYLKLTVTEGSTSATIKSLRIVAKGGEAVSGNFNAEFGSSCSLSAGLATSSAVNVDCGDGVALGTPIIVAIPAQTYAEGFDIYVYTTDKKYQKATSSLSFTAAKGKIYSTGFNYSETGTAIGIWTEQDLKDFLAAADGGKTLDAANSYAKVAWSDDFAVDLSDWEVEGKVHIYDDITLTKKIDWSGTAAKRSCCVSYFNGYLDGMGHTITVAPGTVWTTPMFIQVYGTIANLTFEGSFDAKHASFLSSPIINTTEDGAVIENVISRVNVSNTAGYNHYMAGIVSQMYGGTLRNCKNYGDISFSMTTSAPSSSPKGEYLGGVVAVASRDNGGTIVIENCVNYGNINVTVTRKSGTANYIQAGGVAGYLGRGVTSFSGCENRAEVFNTQTATSLGGVVSSARCNVTNCHNYTPIVWSSETSTTSIGGVINWIGAGYTISNCTNNASITVGASPHVGGVISDAYCAVEDCTNNGTFIFDDSSASSYVGGVASRTLQTSGSDPGSLLRCRNTADVSVGCGRFGGVVGLLDKGTATDCTNSGKITFCANNCSAAGIAYSNSAEMSNCDNGGEITCASDSCNVAGVVVMSNGTMTGCDNISKIKVTGMDTPAAGICFNLRSGATISNCNNSGGITVDVTPTYAGAVSFAGGIVGVVSANDFGQVAAPDILPQTGGSSGYYYPLTGNSGNTLSALVTISECENTGAINFTPTVTSSTFLRNIAVGGIVAWNWAATTSEKYLYIYKCKNGVSGKTSGRIDFTQTGTNKYTGPALGGILGQSSPYTVSSNCSILANSPGFSSNVDNGMKVIIEECESYARIAHLGSSYSTSASANTNRNMRHHGGIAGVLMGKSGTHAQVKNCISAAYICVGVSSSDSDATCKARQSVTNVAGGVAGLAGFIDVEGTTVSTSAADNFGVGSTTRYLFACGGVLGAAIEQFKISGCTIHTNQGYLNSKSQTNYGIAVGITKVGTNRTNTTTLVGSEITNNHILVPDNGFVVNSSALSITSENFTNYIISATDQTYNSSLDEPYVTISGNTWE